MYHSTEANGISSSLIFFGVILCYLLSGGRISISLAGIVFYFMIQSKQNSEEANNSVKKGKKKCCGGKGGPGCCSSGAAVEELGGKKKGCCGGSCHSKKKNDLQPAVDVAYDEGEIDFTQAFKRN